MTKGYLSLVLHAHLPFTRHPEYEEFLEEDWLFEAITETYLPLINIFDCLIADKVPFKITLSLSPTLIFMLQDPLLQARTLRYLNRSVELAEKEICRTRQLPEINELAAMYHQRLAHMRALYCKYHYDIVGVFKEYQESGVMEIITCAATHALLPLIAQNRNAVRAQIFIAVEQYKRIFGKNPLGIWLPECAYMEGLDEILNDHGIKYFFLDAHGILHGKPRPQYGVFAPVRCPSGIHAFGRDMVSSRQVWNSKSGYPGDADYRDFYRDIGFDLEQDYIHPYVQPDGKRKFTGIKYFRITGEEEKKVYCRKSALKKAAMHAEDFIKTRELQIDQVYAIIKKEPTFVSLFDAELFGHWWFEGPEWLDFLLRKTAFESKKIELTTPAEDLNRHTDAQRLSPAASSWGEEGYFKVWLNESNDWIYRRLHHAADRISVLALRFKDWEGEVERALNQAARELLLAQASDWAFILKAGTSVEYAKKRVRDHINRFHRLCDEVESNHIDSSWLKKIEDRDNIFPEMDFRVYLQRDNV